MNLRAPPRRRPDAREIAAVVLARVEKTGAFASAALDAELARTVQLEARDRAFATELVYGSLRALPWLRSEIVRCAPRGIDTLDARVRGHLFLATYQLYFTRVPAFAAVSEAVEAIRCRRGARVASFANAVLRKLAERAESMDDAERQDAMVASAPLWLREALERALSPVEAGALLRCGTEPPAVALRVEHAAQRDAWVERLRAAAPEASIEPGRLSPRAILARGAGKPQRLPGWDEGAWTVQEEGSQLAALAVGAREGDTVLDACAGRGNKTAVLARAVGARGAVDACDANASKLEQLGEELARVGLAARATFAVDWTVGSGEVTGMYDQVLVDAPCSGVGTLRRRPEIALRRQAPDLRSMARRQIAIASRAAAHVRPGGVLVYVVCSVLREEAEDVVDALIRACPDLELAPFEALEIRALFGEAPFFRLLPQVHGTDGYFVARLRRRLR
ncbi:MAG TPA: transcription antitermination factor NusB [Polyangiaceae bacterium]|nr:transcription antitermination factor NusB [Polyangiaceae bacterium]